MVLKGNLASRMFLLTLIKEYSHELNDVYSLGEYNSDNNIEFFIKYADVRYLMNKYNLKRVNGKTNPQDILTKLVKEVTLLSKHTDNYGTITYVNKSIYELYATRYNKHTNSFEQGMWLFLTKEFVDYTNTLDNFYNINLDIIGNFNSKHTYGLYDKICDAAQRNWKSLLFNSELIYDILDIPMKSSPSRVKSIIELVIDDINKNIKGLNLEVVTHSRLATINSYEFKYNSSKLKYKVSNI